MLPLNWGLNTLWLNNKSLTNLWWNLTWVFWECAKDEFIFKCLYFLLLCLFECHRNTFPCEWFSEQALSLFVNGSTYRGTIFQSFTPVLLYIFLRYPVQLFWLIFRHELQCEESECMRKWPYFTIVTAWECS